MLIRYDFDSSLQRLVETRSKGLMTEYTLHLKKLADKINSSPITHAKSPMDIANWRDIAQPSKERKVPAGTLFWIPIDH